MKKTILAVLIGVVFGASGCSKIYFHNDGDSAKSSNLQYDEWHHIGILSLVEFSDPVDLNNRCEGRDWRTVKTHQNFVQGFVGLVAGVIYEPHGVEYSCVKAPAATSPKKN